MSQVTESDIQTAVSVACEVAENAIAAMSPLVQQAVYQLLYMHGCRLPVSGPLEGRLRELARLHLEQGGR